MLLGLSGYYQVSLTASIASHSLTVSNSTVSLNVDAPGGLEAFSGDAANAGFLGFDSNYFQSLGGSTVSVAGTLTNTGQVVLGQTSGNATAGTTCEVGAVNNTGQIDLQGGTAAAPVLAAIMVQGAAPAVLTGNIQLLGDSFISYGSGQVGTIGGAATVSLSGALAHIADASDTSTSSALTGLTEIDGTLALLNGNSVAVGGGLVVAGR